MQKRTNLIILVVGLLVAFGLGFGIGKSTSPESKVTKNQLISDLEGKLESKVEKGLIFLDASYGEKRVRTSLSGEVIKTEENILTVKVANRYQGGKFFDYLNEPNYYEKRVKVEKDTEIVKLLPTSPEEMPFPFQEEKASLSELKEGIKVFVEAKSEFDLAKTEEILAKKIEIRE